METTLDPRAVRTRKLLIDSFNQLLETKDFTQISIKDITEIATVNRATFYAHFVDKYELLDIVLSDNIINTMKEHFTCHAQLDTETVTKMFLSIVHLHDNMHAGCRRGYNTFTSMIAEKTKAQLVEVVMLLVKQTDRVHAVMFSAALYGAYEEWYQHSKLAPEVFAESIATSLLSLVGC